MPPALPDGDAVPADGALPPGATDALGARGFGAYVHVPFCAVRCGYCDFNTYTTAELGPGASPATYAASVRTEIALAGRVLGAPDTPPLDTVFFGGGTPTLLAAVDLAAVLGGLRETFGLAPGAEVTTEANPDSVDLASLSALRAAGVNRISYGMQSAVPHVLRTLDRTHDPDRVPRAVEWARAAGFDSVSVDLIYGTPGESTMDWQRSLDVALALRPDHVSAYALVVEPGTALARRVRRGEVAAPDDDELADRYVQADETLGHAGFAWYEVSNWAAAERHRCRHNELYWQGGDWWGFGPGAHSHVGGTRWWNVKHPAAYAARLADGVTPAAAREVLDAATQRMEQVLLGVRLRGGLPVHVLSGAGRRAADRAAADGLLDRSAIEAGRAVLTRRGRLLADAVVRDLVD